MKIIDELNPYNSNVNYLIFAFLYGKYNEISYSELRSRIGQLHYFQFFHLLAKACNFIKWNKKTVSLFFDFDLDDLSTFKANCLDTGIEKFLKPYITTYDLVEKFYFYSHQHKLIRDIFYKMWDNELELVLKSIKQSEFGKSILINHGVNEKLSKEKQITLNEFIRREIDWEFTYKESEISSLHYPQAELSTTTSSEIEEFRNYIILVVTNHQVIGLKNLSLMPCFFNINNYAIIVTYILKNSNTENEFQLHKAHFLNALKYYKRFESQYSNGVFYDRIKRVYKIHDLELQDNGTPRDFFEVEHLIDWIETTFVSKNNIHLNSKLYYETNFRQLLKSNKKMNDEDMNHFFKFHEIYNHKIVIDKHQDKDKIKLLASPNDFFKILLLFFEKNLNVTDGNSRGMIRKFIKNIALYDNNKYRFFKNDPKSPSINFFTSKSFRNFSCLLFFLEKNNVLELPGPTHLTRLFQNELEYLNIGNSRRETFSKLKKKTANELLKISNLSWSLLGVYIFKTDK